MILNVDTVRATLQELKDPWTGRDYVSGREARNIRVEGSDVSVEIVLGYPSRSIHEQIRAQVAAALGAQPRSPLPSPEAVDPGQLYHRVLAVCPLIGEGTYSDPKRPALIPSNLNPDANSGLDVIRAFAWVPSDDGTQAIVEIVVRDAVALTELRRAARSVAGTTFHDRAAPPRSAAHAALRRLKKDFNPDSLRAVAP
jgi:hypothetical protein